MLVSPCFTLLVGCMIKRLLVVGRAAVLYWVHVKSFLRLFNVIWNDPNRVQDVTDGFLS